MFGKDRMYEFITPTTYQDPWLVGGEDETMRTDPIGRSQANPSSGLFQCEIISKEINSY